MNNFWQFGWRLAGLMMGLWSALAMAAEDPEVSAIAPLPPPPPNGVIFKSVRDLNQKKENVAEGDIMLRGGAAAESLDWPASVYFTYVVKTRTYTCTGALVGPTTLLTAAHCVPPNGNVSMTFDNETYNAECEAHAGYTGKQDVSADFALCRLGTDFKPPLNFKYERVRSIPLDQLKKDRAKLLLGGFGCTHDGVLASTLEDLDETYRIGMTTVSDTSLSPPPSAQQLKKLYSPQQNFNIITELGQANLCPGDSGGPVFFLGAKGYATRSIVAVNSRVLYADYPKNEVYGASVLAAVGAASPPDLQNFENWAKAWAGAAGSICGLIGAPPKCREP